MAKDNENNYDFSKIQITMESELTDEQAAQIVGSGSGGTQHIILNPYIRDTVNKHGGMKSFSVSGDYINTITCKDGSVLLMSNLHMNKNQIT